MRREIRDQGIKRGREASRGESESESEGEGASTKNEKMIRFTRSETTKFVVVPENPLITAPHGHLAWPLKCFEVHHPMKRA